jgi:hypothetical protein
MCVQACIHACMYTHIRMRACMYIYGGREEAEVQDKGAFPHVYRLT